MSGFKGQRIGAGRDMLGLQDWACPFVNQSQRPGVFDDDAAVCPSLNEKAADARFRDATENLIVSVSGHR